MRTFATYIINHPRWIIAGIIGLTILAAFPASQIRTDFNLENFYPKDDKTVQQYRYLEEEFGRDDNIIVVGFKSDSLLTPSVLRELKAMVDSVKTIPTVTEVNSIWSAEEIINQNQSLQFEPYLSEQSLEEDVQQLKSRISGDPFTEGFFISEDAKTTAFYIKIDADSNTYDSRNQITTRLKQILNLYPARDFKISGIPYFRNQYVNTLNSEVLLYLSISSALIIMLLWYLYRSAMGVLLPMVIVWLTVLFTIATVSLSGGYLEIMSSTIAPILLCVGVADSIHMISKFDDLVQSGLERTKAIIQMVLTLGSATFLTSITTAIGFGTLLSSTVVPMKRFGIYTAIGVLIAYTITILLLPSILKITKIRKVFSTNGGRLYPLLGIWLLKLSDFNAKNYKRISWMSLGVTLLIALGIFQLKVNGRVFDDVSRDSQLIKDSNFFARELAPPFPMEFIVDTKQENGITDPNFLERLDRFQKYLLSFPEIKRVTSFSSLIKEIHQEMAPEKASQHALPENRNLISQYLLLLEINGSDALTNITDFSYSQVRIPSQVLDVGSLRINTIRDSVEAYINHHFKEEEVMVTGSTILSADLVGKMVYSLAASIGLAFICISIVMALLFRDLKMVLICLIPNIIPLVIIAGFMGFFGVDIKPSTAVIFTIAFGIAVDDTIHYLARFRVELQRGFSLEEALRETTQKTGRAIIITSLILMAGFGTLITSDFTSTTLMGILVGCTILIAVIADLILLPSLFYWLNPSLKGVKVRSDKETAELIPPH
ncbi:MAG: RND family transporter [Balneolaceae bacterium]|nr:RND family transporter [Balneolaceae bacterium]